jgi:hypothetical protein
MNIFLKTRVNFEPLAQKASSDRSPKGENRMFEPFFVRGSKFTLVFKKLFMATMNYINSTVVNPPKSVEKFVT